MPAPRPQGPASKRPPFPWPFARGSSHSPVRGVPVPPGSWGFWGNGHPCSTSPDSPETTKPRPPKTWGVWPPRTPPGRKQVGRIQLPKPSPEAASRLRQEELEQYQVQMQDEHWNFECEQHQSQLQAWLQAERDESQQFDGPQAPNSPCYSPRSSPRSAPGSPFGSPRSPLSSPRCSRLSLIQMSPGTPRINNQTDEASVKSPGRAPKSSPKSSRAGMRSPKATAMAPLPSPSPRPKAFDERAEVKSPKQPRSSPMKASASQGSKIDDAALQETAALSTYEAEMPVREPQQKTKAFVAVCSTAAPSPRLHAKKSTIALAGSPTQLCEKTSVTNVASSSTDPAEIEPTAVRSPRLFEKTSTADVATLLNTTGQPMPETVPSSKASLNVSEAPAAAVRRRIRSKTPPQLLEYQYPAEAVPAAAAPRRRLNGKQPPPPGTPASAPSVRGRKRRASAPAAVFMPSEAPTATPRRRITGKQPPPQAAPVAAAPRRSDVGDGAPGDAWAAAEVAPRRRITGKRPASAATWVTPGTPPPRWDKEQVSAAQGALESAEKLRLNTARRRNAAPKEVGQFVAVIGDGWGGGGSCPHQAIVTEVEATTYNVALIKGDQVLRKTRVLKEFCEAVGPASPNWPGVEAVGSPSCAASKRTQDGEPPKKKRGRSAPPKAARGRVSI